MVESSICTMIMEAFKEMSKLQLEQIDPFFKASPTSRAVSTALGYDGR